MYACMSTDTVIYVLRENEITIGINASIAKGHIYG